MKIICSSIFLCLISTFAYSDCASILENHVGWTIIASKTIEGYKDRGKEKKDDFEGCDFDRIVYFMDGTTVTCNSYGYQYSFMPKAIILGKSVTYNEKKLNMIKMLVDGNEYDVR
jgi:hypothetical protein